MKITPTQHLKSLLLDLKGIISDINAFAVKHEIFTEYPTRILQLSCECDEIIGLVDDKIIEESE